MKTYTAIVASALIVASTINMVTAREEYLKEIPNGSKFTKVLGHKGASDYTDFGTAFQEAGFKWKTICDKPFPGTSITVGQAFGDPCCTWKKGETPQFEVSWTTDPGQGTTCPSSNSAEGSASTPKDEEFGGEVIDKAGGKGDYGATDEVTDKAGGKKDGESTGGIEEVDSVGGKKSTGEYGATESTGGIEEVDSVGGKKSTGEHGASNEAGSVAGLLATDSGEEFAETKGIESAESTGEHEASDEGEVLGSSTDGGSGPESLFGAGEGPGKPGVELALGTSLLPPLDSTDPYGKGPSPSGGGCAAKRARKLRH
ncbi:unnamed protein product [Peronospora belbahrii]|uniref:Temptin Cys/Cys disulfide domain-containing protein n=1 Tax=Peronospora belbahrii TaxID=622444 RepID=A0AAU9L1X7_9STRA|nr:unnamed protein product [Peronospora belbahrii]